MTSSIQLLSTTNRNIQPEVQKSEEILAEGLKHSLTRRVDSEDYFSLTRSRINTQADLLPHLDHALHQLAHALNEQNWGDPIFKDPQYPHYALEAVRREVLSKKSFATVALYWALVQAQGAPEKICVVPVFLTNGDPNPDASRLLQETLAMPNQKSLQLNDSEWQDFFARLKMCPQSEQQFFLYLPTPLYRFDQTMAYRLISRANVFHGLGLDRELRTPLYLMLASFGMMQTYLDVKFKQNAIQLRPVIGASSLSDMRQSAKQNQRDFGLNFPTYVLDEADGCKAPWEQFSKHDFYHAIILSFIPESHRNRFNELSDLLFPLIVQAEKASELRKRLNDSRRRLIDLEGVLYKQYYSCLPVQTIFWLQLDLFLIPLTLPDFSEPLLTKIVQLIQKTDNDLFSYLEAALLKRKSSFLLKKILENRSILRAKL